MSDAADFHQEQKEEELRNTPFKCDNDGLIFNSKGEDNMFRQIPEIVDGKTYCRDCYEKIYLK